MVRRDLKELLQSQNDISYAVDATVKVLQEIFAARADSECPEWMQSDNIVGGLITAVGQLNDKTLQHSWQLGDAIEGSLVDKEASNA